MINLEKFYPGKKLEAFRLGSSALAHEPDGSEYCIDCDECPARDYCDNDKEYITCIDTFEAWAKMEAV